ncbi:MAG TPA: bi-domain-containing oxidoreductase [Ferruginibacter sp.]|nr:bi-domain-containing oxidoreductase [Ferruginibacter sp.]HNF42016.1 bi-domain-containing oxidoreductase [Ferruginibacter sp.]HNG62171.1 bi-domain-containing oxidoreductase [Ferruginibacter sp.]HNH20537.1 bi-domain-containing oxidoreductase [Ferruginibacter sp.]HNJ28180.1 bi-domain-containing oxidoreductase [Ferruginibacter sp.]
MKQVIQNFKTGELYVDDVPLPSLSEGMVLIENHFSLISAGTERGTVKVAQANLINKARQRPDLVAQVIQNIKKEGLKATIAKVKSKLDSLKALGYSTAGTVISSMDTNGVFKPGDRVACAGVDYASHAEIVAVPQNLVVKVPDEVRFEDAAYTTLGAIAMQGIRQAETVIGEKVCVIGLGLLGQITCQLLQANGCAVFGLDLSESFVGIANKYSADKAMLRNDPNLRAACDNFTNGHGFDTVIITAATQSNDPIELAGDLCRKKGKVVVVGVVPMDIPRDPNYYRKEIDIKMSCSYGPGRYDVNYEENGQDYPYAYVRWTEQRNMETFLDLLAREYINLKPLTTHVIDIADAEKAYDIILGKVKEPHIGILLRYSENETKARSVVTLAGKPLSQVNAAFIGAGSFAQSYLIPNVKASGASLDGVVTSRGITAKNVANKFGFNFCSSSVNDVLGKQEVNTIFIATPHNSHAELTIQSLQAGKAVFVEKPLAINTDQLQEVIETKKKHNHPLMVGFNRRFAPVSIQVKKEFASAGEPIVMNMRINAGMIPKDNWLQQKDVGAGRIIGEMCHFIDLMQFFTGSEPVRVFAECISTSNDKITPADNISIVVKFKDGSVGNLTYLANGDKGMPKELIEVFGGSRIGVINDFRDGLIYKSGKTVKLKSSGKGHKEEVDAFIGALKAGQESPISFRSICLTTLTTFKIHDSLHTGLPQDINVDELL